jgi:hypothetical protein
MANPQKKEFSIEEIRKIAPGYRGKPENFELSKVGQKPKPKARASGPKSPMLTPPTSLAKNANPTEQKNELMLQEF